MRTVILLIGFALGALANTTTVRAQAPYPPSDVVTGITWETGTYRYAGAGGDIWPVTWAQGGSVRTAWGDGVVGCGTKVSYGVAALSGGPSTNLATIGCGPTGTNKGKILSLLAVGSHLYAIASLQNRAFPYADYAVWRSSDGGQNWQKATWVFPGSEGSTRPASFVNFGQGYAGARDGYVYLLATRAGSDAQATNVYLLRVPPANLQLGKSSYEYFSGTRAIPAWSQNVAAARPVFSDPHGVRRPEMVRNASLGRYLLTMAHYQPGRLGLFEAPEPWGQWRTVTYQESWLGMASTGAGHYLGVRFPTKWMADGGRTVWAVFSCHDNTAPGACGKYHDRYNLMRARLTVAGP